MSSISRGAAAAAGVLLVVASVLTWYRFDVATSAIFFGSADDKPSPAPRFSLWEVKPPAAILLVVAAVVLFGAAAIGRRVVVGVGALLGVVGFVLALSASGDRYHHNVTSAETSYGKVADLHVLAVLVVLVALAAAAVAVLLRPAAGPATARA